MAALRALVATTAFRWTLAIAGGFTAMSLFLFTFIYWQTAVQEQGRIDGSRAVLLGDDHVLANSRHGAGRGWPTTPAWATAGARWC
jgi:hypothetical protein